MKHYTNFDCLYHLSEKKFVDTHLVPREVSSIGLNEDPTIKRICFAPSIHKCLQAIRDRIRDGTKTFYVYRLLWNNELEYKIPTTDDVFDANVTNEVWILSPCDVVLVDKVTVVDELTGIEKYMAPFKHGKKAEECTMPIFTYKSNHCDLN